MKTYIRPSRDEQKRLLSRPTFDPSGLNETVGAVLRQVRERGDDALREFTRQFDQVVVDAIRVSAEEMDQAGQQLSEELQQAIRLAARNIEAFHQAQDGPMPDVTTVPGVRCWQKAVAIDKVGLYVPGGTAPLFSTVLMLAIPARLAGCAEIVLCTPPDRNGNVHPAVLFAARIAGVDQVFRIGGVQAIGAMAYGTESVPAVYKIFGPGNQYVTAAKQLVGLRDVAIDMPAGPSEVEVLADDSAVPAFVASDLLSQAEHGRDSQAILITTSPELAKAVEIEVQRQLGALSRKDLAAASLENSRILVMDSLEEALEATNEYAPEHLILAVREPQAVAERIRNAGSVFVGHLTPESAGDYASGTNHTLPTNGYARMYSGVNLDSFRKKITFQEISPEGLQNIGPAIETMASAESLDAHRQAVTLRLAALRSPSSDKTPWN